MNRCIFCLTTDGPFRTREHVLPESLGGGDWAILPPGLLCDSCQNRFGSAIEQQALADYPFSLLRVFLGIPTKKGKPPWLECWEGRFQSGFHPGVVAYDPAPYFSSALMEGQKTQVRILAEPQKPDFICRTLLKMGLEFVATRQRDDVFCDRFDEARSYALRGIKTSPWWYFQLEDLESHRRVLQGCPIPSDLEMGLDTLEIEDHAEVFRLKPFHLIMLCPLESRIMPPSMDEFEEPKHRLFVIP
jgi:HNH endonuclease